MSVFAESGELAWISMTIQLQTGTAVGGQQGGFMSVLGRAIAGATIFMTEYTPPAGWVWSPSAPSCPARSCLWRSTLDAARWNCMAKSCRTTSRRETRIHPGHVAMSEDSVDFNVTTMPGIRNALFGWDGLFLATLTGPGRIWLQSMSMSRLAHAIAHYLPHHSESGLGGLLAGN